MSRDEQRCPVCGRPVHLYPPPWPKLAPVELAPDAFLTHDLPITPDRGRLPPRPVVLRGQSTIAPAVG